MHTQTHVAASAVSNPKYYHLDKHYMNRPLVFGKCRLFQIGRLYCTPQTRIEEHAHINWFELTIATGGKGVVYTNGVGVPIERGDIYLSFPCDFHAITPDATDPLKYDFFSFGVDDEALAADLEQILQTHMPADRRLLRDETISSLVSAAIAEINTEKRYSQELLNAMLTQLIIRLVRGFLGQSPEGLRANATESDTLCYRLMNYIDTHIYTMTGLEELAEAMNYNYSYLSSLFRKVTSGTLSDYYRNRRLETARLLILENELSISHVADLLHYSSIYTFSRAFKDQYGLSPEQYRKKMMRDEF